MRFQVQLLTSAQLPRGCQRTRSRSRIREPDDDDAFRHEQRSLQHLAAAVAAQPSAGGDHAVARDVGPAAAAHDVADGARRARPAGERRDLAVRRDAPRRNAPHHRQHAVRESAASLGVLLAMRTEQRDVLPPSSPDPRARPASARDRPASPRPDSVPGLTPRPQQQDRHALIVGRSPIRACVPIGEIIQPGLVANTRSPLRPGK